MREPVLFSAAVQALEKDGHDVFLEISPHPICSARSIRDFVTSAGTAPRLHPFVARKMNVALSLDR